MSACDCSLWGDGVPAQWQFVISGITNTGSCSDCTNLNGTYILSATGPCTWGYSPGGACSGDYTSLTLTLTTFGASKVLSLAWTPNSFFPGYKSTALKDLYGSITLVKSFSILPSNCAWPLNASLTAVTPSLSDWANFLCLP